MKAISNVTLITRSQENNIYSPTRAIIETYAAENAIIIMTRG